ncbi:outer membrane protein [Ahrensia sp. 13_GOM-1096m]|uniref:outer membrane protein n=1 Tax=Ahrensia sp. 13_GOM-1096m TaxID=1380380 RepID=UPI000479F17B|nr:outer membrane beta-barrel protein [Ahrensia sp. 13_GOM-1096m]
MHILKYGLLIAALSTGSASAADSQSALADANFDQRWSWSGFNVGVIAGYGTQSDEQVLPGGTVYAAAEGEGDVYGAFIGYSHQMGNFVAGIEGSYQKYDTMFRDNDRVTIEDMWSVTARLGYAIDRFHGYAFIGGAMGNTTSPNTILEGRDIGLVYGAGLDVGLTENLYAGVQYQRHEFDDFADLPLPVDINASMNTYTFRLGYKF